MITVIVGVICFIFGFITFPMIVGYSAHQDYKETNEHNNKRQQLSDPDSKPSTEEKEPSQSQFDV